MNRYYQAFWRSLPGAALVAFVSFGLTTFAHAQSIPDEDPFLPPDGKLVAYSIAFALEGRTSPPPPFQSVDLKDTLVKVDPDLSPGAFQVSGLRVYGYSLVDNVSDRRQFAGMIVHRDPFGRYSSHTFLTRYRINSDGKIAVETAKVIPIPSAAPPVRFAIVPADRFRADWLTGAVPLDELMFLISEEDLKAGDPRLTSGPRDYIVFAMFMDRVLPNTSIGLEITSDAGKAPAASVIRHGGWRIAYAKGRFDLAKGAKTVFRAVVRTQGVTKSQPLAELTLPLG